MVALDTSADNLCLWRCIAVDQQARPDQSTQAARELAKSYFKLRTGPNDVQTTSVVVLYEVEGHPNEGLPLSDWLDLTGCEPERQENAEIVWHLRKNPSDNLECIMTIGIYDKHGFLIKDIKKLAKLYARVDCQAHLANPGNRPETSRKNIRSRKNNYQLSQPESRSAKDSIRESFLQLQQSTNFCGINPLACAHKQGVEKPYPSCFMRGWG